MSGLALTQREQEVQLKPNNLALSMQANYTDRETATCRRVEGCRVVSVTSPHLR
jgi:hypothetical protein